MNYVEIISAALGGGLIKSLFDYWNSSRSNRKEELTQVISTWQTDNERLRKENESLRGELDLLRNDVAELRAKVILMESAHSDAPLPMWLKDTSGRMLSLNKQCEESFLFPLGKKASDYIGKSDSEVWGEEIAKEYRIHDNLALLYDFWKGIEHVQTPSEITEWIIIKYARYVGKAKIGIAGIAIPINWENYKITKQ